MQISAVAGPEIGTLWDNGWEDGAEGLLLPFHNGDAECIPGYYARPFLRYNARAGTDYSISRTFNDGKGLSVDDIFFQDARYAIVLQADSIPIAIESFEFYPDRTIKVVQIQGRNMSKRNSVMEERAAYDEIRKIWWEGLLLAYLADWAWTIEAKRVSVQAAKANEYYKRGAKLDRSEMLLNRRLERRYDGTSKALGFLPSLDESYFYLDL